MEIKCLAGLMGKRAVYSGFVTIEAAVRIFSTYDPNLDVERRAQRTPKKSRIPDVIEYLTKHRRDWVFPSFTVSFAGASHYESGKLKLDLSQPLLVHDGQHRFLALERAIELLPELAREHISVLFLKRPNLEAAQQLFADLNRHAKTPSKSLLVIYDKDEALNRITVSVAKRSLLFIDKVEKERTFVTRRSRNVTSMSALYQANERLLKYDRVLINSSDESATDLAVRMWDLISSVIPQYSDIANGYVSPADIREEYILGNSLVFWAIGDAVAELMHTGRVTRKRLLPLGEINWSKTNRSWQGLVMLGSDIITRRQSRAALSQYIQYKLGLVGQPPHRVFDEAGNPITD